MFDSVVLKWKMFKYRVNEVTLRTFFLMTTFVPTSQVFAVEHDNILQNKSIIMYNSKT